MNRLFEQAEPGRLQMTGPVIKVLRLSRIPDIEVFRISRFVSSVDWKDGVCEADFEKRYDDTMHSILNYLSAPSIGHHLTDMV